jgi:hypothetical protein
MYGGNCAALFETDVLSAKQMTHCAFLRTRAIVLIVAVAVHTTAEGVSRMRMKYGRKYVVALVSQNFTSR